MPWLTQDCGLQAVLQLWTPLLHCASYGQKIQENGLADKQSTLQARLPRADVPAPHGPHKQERQRGSLCTEPGQGGGGLSVDRFLQGFRGES